MANVQQDPVKKQWILNAFGMSTPGHLAPGTWRHPRNRSAQYTDIEYWVDLAKVLEAGKFHSLFLADVLGQYDVYKGSIEPGLPGSAQFPNSDPFLPIAAMAAVTKNLSFGITASTTYENPFLLARRFATLDHLTKGRIGWNVVTSHLESAAKNVGLGTQVPHDERYRMADEYLSLTYKLWEGSWRHDAVVKDIETKQYTVPGRVRQINHEGKYFKSQGPLTTEPSIQRTPFLFQAGTSTAGKEFAVKHAESIFLVGSNPQAIAKSARDIRLRAVEAGRDPAGIKLVAGVLVIVDETDEKAQAKWAEYLNYVDLESTATLFGGWTGTDLSQFDDDDDFRFTAPPVVQGLVAALSATTEGDVKWTKRRVLQEVALAGANPRVIGSPKTVADTLETWIREGEIDGFNLSYVVNPGDFEDIVKYLLPELRARGVFWDDYRASTARENFLGDNLGPRLRKDHPGSSYRWSSEEDTPP